MRSSLKPRIRETGREAPKSESNLDRCRGSKDQTIDDRGVSSAAAASAAANSTAFGARKTKRNSAAGVRRELCEKIHAKMQFLEEDTRLMKEAILDCLRDRDMLMSEVSHKLHMIREHLSVISSECELDCPPTRVCSFDPLKDDRKDIGLLGVLHQDLTPTLVARRRPEKINVDGAFD